MLTKQAIFNKAVNGLLKQKAPAIIKDRCVFKTADGLKCAIGFAIPDERYKKSFEGQEAWRVLANIGVINPDNFTKAQFISWTNFLQSLQDAHDNSAFNLKEKLITNFVEDLKPSLKNIAQAYKLKLPAALKK